MKKIYDSLSWWAIIVALTLTACGNNQQPAEPAKENKVAVEAPVGQAEQGPASADQESIPPADQPPPAEQGAPATAPHK